MMRYLIYDGDQYPLVERILDEHAIDYEWDGGDRLMIDDDCCENVERLLDDNDIDYDCV